MPSKPTPLVAEQAAESLGLHVWTLSRLLRSAAVDELQRQARRVQNDESLETGEVRRLLWAAEACEAAWDAVTAARVEVETM